MLLVPEIGPWLGKVLEPSRLRSPADLEPAREALLERLIALAGEARSAAARGESAVATAALGPAQLEIAWRRAASEAAGALASAIDAALADAAFEAGRSGWTARRLRLSAAERRGVEARLAQAGALFLAALPELDAAARAVDGSADSRAAWEAALRRAFGRLEAAWLALSAGADRLWADEWMSAVRAVRERRPRRWPWVAAALLAALALVAGGLMVGGYLPAPEWMESLVWTRPQR